METTLVLITIASLAVAATMSVVAWRLARDERARSEARVAALAAAIDDLGDQPLLVATPAPARRRVASTVHGTVATPSCDATLHSLATALDAADGPGANDLFSTSTRDERSARHFGPAFVLGALAVSALIGTLFLAGGTGDASSQGAAAPVPLELLSLRHVEHAGKIEITGLVRNPKGARTVEQVTAVVSFLDGEGAFLSTARAPLDFRRLAGGEESVFVVTAPTPPGVRRYRASFRLADGDVVPHVDRRENQP